jgi:hypothetical protein
VYRDIFFLQKYDFEIMNRTIIFILILNLFFSGCINSSIEATDKNQTYYMEKDPQNYIVLHEDNTFIMSYIEITSGGDKFDLSNAGIYKIENGTDLFLITSRGTGKLRMDNKTLIDKDGERWIQK